ncbi:MAG: tetratricopeptide repeat protein [Flavobacteriales bacterium]
MNPRTVTQWLLVVFLSTAFQTSVLSQQAEIDSLGKILNDKNTNDTTQTHILHRLTELLYLSNFDTIVPLATRAIKIADAFLAKKQTKFMRRTMLRHKATGVNNLGFYYFSSGRADDAVACFKKALKLQLQVNDYDGISGSYNNLASIFSNQGNIEEALNYYQRSLKLGEKINDKNRIAYAKSNIAGVYDKMGQADDALKLFQEAEKIFKSIKGEIGLSMVYHNMASNYEARNNQKQALKYYLEALELKEKTGDVHGAAYTLNNIANIYLDRGENDKAFECFMSSYKKFLVSGDPEGLANSYGNMGTIYLRRNDLALAKRYADSAYILAKRIGFPATIRNAALIMYKVYDKQRNFEKAIEMYREYSLMRDSVINDANRKAAMRSQYKFEYEQRSLTDSIQFAKADELNRAKIARQKAEIKAKRNTQLALFGGLALVLVFAFIMYNRFRITRRQKLTIEDQKKEVELQKHMVDEKQKEITDSINYAKRIQYSLLAHTDLLKSNLKDFFVLFKPKDIVSGDFYWATKKNEGFYLAVCDSTGHGVPGAFMSLLNISFLNEAIAEKNILEPHTVLNHVRSRLIESMEGGQDGMDAVLVRFNGNKLQYAAANIRPVMIRNGKLTELNADKMPVGKGEKSGSFTLHEIEIIKGDQFFFFTDGYADQFGGPGGKKFKHSSLQKLISDNAQLDSQALSLALQHTFEDWKGMLEQVDDVCLIGIRI